MAKKTSSSTIKELLYDNKVSIAIIIVIGILIIGYFGVSSPLQPGSITGVDCANTTLPDDYCEGTTFFSNPVCEDGTITFDITENSEDCGYIAPEPDNATAEPEPEPEATEEPTQGPTLVSTPVPTIAPTAIPTAEATATPAPTPEPEPEEQNPILEFLQGIIYKIYDII